MRIHAEEALWRWAWFTYGWCLLSDHCSPVTEHLQEADDDQEDRNEKC